MAIQLNCGNCGGILDIDPEKPTVECSFCGSRFSVSDLLNESERIQIERIRKDVELGRQNLELERIRQAEAEIQRTETAKKSVIGKAAIAFAVIALMMCISAFVHIIKNEAARISELANQKYFISATLPLKKSVNG